MPAPVVVLDLKAYINPNYRPPRHLFTQLQPATPTTSSSPTSVSQAYSQTFRSHLHHLQFSEYSHTPESRTTRSLSRLTVRPTFRKTPQCRGQRRGRQQISNMTSRLTLSLCTAIGETFPSKSETLYLRRNVFASLKKRVRSTSLAEMASLAGDPRQMASLDPMISVL